MSTPVRNIAAIAYQECYGSIGVLFTNGTLLFALCTVCPRMVQALCTDHGALVTFEEET